MKFITYTATLLILLLLHVSVVAQDSEAETLPVYKRFVGGSIAYERNDGGIGNRSQNFGGLNDRVFFNVQPFVGKQIGEKLHVGLTAGFTLQESAFSGFGLRTISSSEFNLGLFVRNQLISRGNFTFLLESSAVGSYEYGRYYESSSAVSGSQNEIPYRGPYGFTFSLSPRVSYDLSRFRFLATFGSAGISATASASNTRGEFLAVGGSRIFVSAFSRFFGISAEYKF